MFLFTTKNQLYRRGGDKMIMEKNARDFYYIVAYFLVNFHDERYSGGNK